MKNSIFRSALSYGNLIGIVLIIVSLVDWLLQLHGQNFLYNLLSFAVIVAGLLWSGFSFRKEEGGYVSYGRVYAHSLVVILLFSLASTVFMVVHMTWIDPGYIDRLLVLTEQKMYDMNLPSESIDAAMAIQSKLMHPAIITLSSFIGGVVMSALIALVTSAFAKKNPPASF